jgi:hypothetical protein
VTSSHVSLVREASSSALCLLVGDDRQTVLHIRSRAEWDRLGLRADRVTVLPDGDLSGLPRLEMGPPGPVSASSVFLAPSDIVELNCKDSASVVCRDVLVAGWLKQSPAMNWWFDVGVEDAHYGDLLLDIEFLDRMYGPGGLSGRLDNVRLPGNPTTGDVRVLEVAQDSRRGVTANSFTLGKKFDHSAPTTLALESNAWHEHDHVGKVRTFPLNFYRYTGRGPHPEGWMKRAHPDHLDADDQWWPYDPFYPVNDKSRPLQAGDYVVMWGTLWQDLEHNDETWTPVAAGHAGWLELHPIDWIGRVPAPVLRRRAGLTIAYVGAGDINGSLDSGFPDNVTFTVVNDGGPPGHSPPSAVKCTCVVSFVATVAPPHVMTLACEPASIPTDRPTAVTIRAHDAAGSELTGATVFLDGTQVGVTGMAFSETFTGHWTVTIEDGPNGKPHRVRTWAPPTASVRVTLSGFADGSLNLTFDARD